MRDTNLLYTNTYSRDPGPIDIHIFIAEASPSKPSGNGRRTKSRVFQLGADPPPAQPSRSGMAPLPLSPVTNGRTGNRHSWTPPCASFNQSGCFGMLFIGMCPRWGAVIQCTGLFGVIRESYAVTHLELKLNPKEYLVRSELVRHLEYK